MTRRFIDPGEAARPAPSGLCPECGADWSGGRTCQQIFDELLALEFSDPAFGKVHFLSVACFMIQHRRYSRQALAWIETKLKDYFEKGISADEIRRQAGQETQQAKRGWKVRRRPGEPEMPPVEWSEKITDVEYCKDKPDEYCAEIEEWARATLADLQHDRRNQVIA